jgi:hypothetical protein
MATSLPVLQPSSSYKLPDTFWGYILKGFITWVRISGSTNIQEFKAFVVILEIIEVTLPTDSQSDIVRFDICYMHYCLGFAYPPAAKI